MADLDTEKQRVASYAVQHVRDGMIVGLGTGSTAAYAIREIARRIRDEGLRIQGAATSVKTQALATSLGIPMLDFERLSRVDLTIDGADELDPQLRAIKGGGGALLREKVVAAASDREIVIVDSSKLVDVLGSFPLPVEVLPFAAAFVEHSLTKLGAPVVRRSVPRGVPFLTDQGAYVYDLAFGRIDDPAGLARRLEALPGVLAHGLFLGLIDLAVIAEGDTIRTISRDEIQT